MAKWIYKIENSFEDQPSGLASDIAAVTAFVFAIIAGLSWLSF